MEVMFQRNSMCKLEGGIQIDDAYQGGGKSGTCHAIWRPMNGASPAL